MMVVVDTNAIVGDYWLRSKRWKLLLSRADKGLVELHVPEAVVGEVLKHFRSDLKDAVTAIEETERKVNRVQAGPARHTEIDVDGDMTAYEKHLRDTLRDVGTDFTNPAIDSSEVAEMVIARKRPFKANGSGYVDALVWFRVRELARRDDVAFISNDHQDFGGTKSGGIDPELEAQLEGLHDVERYPSPTDFHAAALDHVELYGHEIRDMLADPDTLAGLKDGMLSVLDAREARAAGAWGSIANADNTMFLAGEITRIDLIEVAEADPDVGYATFEVDGRAEYDFPVLLSEGWVAVEEEEIGDFHADDLDAIFGEGSRMVSLSLIVDATFEAGTKELSDFEVSVAEVV